MKRITFFAASLFVMSTFITSCSKNDDNTTIDTSPNQTDLNFMVSAAYANRDEVDFAQLALTKSADDSVKKFAQMMITEHTEAMTSLDSLGNSFNQTLPTTIDSLHAALKTQMQALTGYTFDTAYINGQVRDHINTISLFQTEVSDGRNMNIKNYATNNLPHLQMHLEHADSVKSHLQ